MMKDKQAPDDMIDCPSEELAEETNVPDVARGEAVSPLHVFLVRERTYRKRLRTCYDSGTGPWKWD